MEKRELLYTVGEKVYWSTNCRKVYGGSTKNLKYNYNKIQQFIPGFIQSKLRH